MSTKIESNIEINSEISNQNVLLDNNVILFLLIILEIKNNNVNNITIKFALKNIILMSVRFFLYVKKKHINIYIFP